MSHFYSEKSTDRAVHRYPAMHKCSYRKRMWTQIRVLPTINWFYANSPLYWHSLIKAPVTKLGLFPCTIIFCTDCDEFKQQSYFLILSCAVGGWSVCHHSSGVCFWESCSPGSVQTLSSTFFISSHTPTFGPKTSNCITSDSSLKAKLGQRCASNTRCRLDLQPLRLAPRSTTRPRTQPSRPAPPPSCPPQQRGPPSTAPGPALPNTPKPYKNIKFEG